VGITQARLKELLHYDCETGIFKWIIAPKYSPQLLDKAAGTESPDGYIRIMIDKKSYLAHRLVILYVDGYLPELQVDHKDKTKHNNKYSNLRETSQSCNLRNTGNRSNNRSGVKGVQHSGKGWESTIYSGGKRRYLGKFLDFTEAVAHRLAAEQCLGWSNCDNSSPAYSYMEKWLNDRA